MANHFEKTNIALAYNINMAYQLLLVSIMFVIMGIMNQAYAQRNVTANVPTVVIDQVSDLYTTNNPCLLSVTNKKEKQEMNINLRMVNFYDKNQQENDVNVYMSGIKLVLKYSNQEDADMAFKQLRLSAYYCYGR